jgi:ribonucleoside-diphosphate reductase beta chain
MDPLMALLEPRDYYKPFQYPWAYQAYKVMQSLHWLPHEAPMDKDVLDWQKNLTQQEKSLLTQLFRFFTQADVDVARGYVEKYLKRFPHPELRMLMLAIGASEANHIDAYATLIDTLGLPEVEFKAFLDYEAMRAKHEYMFERETGNGIADLVVDIAVFSAFGEGMQLFSSFAILMSFQRRKLMKGMTTIVEWSIRDESHHVECMIRLLHELIKEHPRAWNDETKKRIYDACRRDGRTGRRLHRSGVRAGRGRGRHGSRRQALHPLHRRPPAAATRPQAELWRQGKSLRLARLDHERPDPHQLLRAAFDRVRQGRDARLG